MGFNLAALIAGTIPNIKPINVEKESERIIGVAVIAVVKLANFVKINDTTTAKSIPSIQKRATILFSGQPRSSK